MFIIEFILACILTPVLWYMDFMASIQNPLLIVILLGIGWLAGAIWGIIWFYVSSGFAIITLSYVLQVPPRSADGTYKLRHYLWDVANWMPICFLGEEWNVTNEEQVAIVADIEEIAPIMDYPVAAVTELVQTKLAAYAATKQVQVAEQQVHQNSPSTDDVLTAGTQQLELAMKSLVKANSAVAIAEKQLRKDLADPEFVAEDPVAVEAAIETVVARRIQQAEITAEETGEVQSKSDTDETEPSTLSKWITWIVFLVVFVLVVRFILSLF